MNRFLTREAQYLSMHVVYSCVFIIRSVCARAVKLIALEACCVLPFHSGRLRGRLTKCTRVCAAGKAIVNTLSKKPHSLLSIVASLLLLLDPFMSKCHPKHVHVPMILAKESSKTARRTVFVVEVGFAIFVEAWALFVEAVFVKAKSTEPSKATS